MGKKERNVAITAGDDQERERVEQTLEIIERAVDGVPPPDAEHRSLRQAEAWDAYEIVDQHRDHKGRWQDLPQSHTRECQQALAHLDEQGIRALREFELRSDRRAGFSGVLEALRDLATENVLEERDRAGALVHRP